MMIFGPQTSETAQLLSILLQVLLCCITFSMAEKWHIDATLLSLTKGHATKPINSLRGWSGNHIANAPVCSDHPVRT
jgi:hypothetical protein